MVTLWFPLPPIVIYDQRLIDSLSFPEVVNRGIISVIAMVTIPLGLCMIFHGVDVSNVERLILDQNYFNILVILYLLLACFQLVLVSDRHATSTAFRNMISFILKG